MKIKIFQPALYLLAALAIALSGCSDFDEMKGQRLLLQAEALIEQGDELHAEQTLTELIARYPNTHAGDAAGQRLMQIRKQRELRERREFAKILDSYHQVLIGYQALYSEYPSSVSTLDQSDYFFDTAYLDEITPAGYQVYLWLKNDGSGYRAWCVANDKDRGYAIESAKSRLVAFERDTVLEKIKSRFQLTPLGEKLVALKVE